MMFAFVLADAAEAEAGTAEIEVEGSVTHFSERKLSCWRTVICGWDCGNSI